MGQADLNFLRPLIDLVQDLTDSPNDQGGISGFGLGGIASGSVLARDDDDCDGFWTSMIVSSSLSASLDHALALRNTVAASTGITNNSPWSTMRGILESASTALWVSSGDSRPARRERAFRVWNHDLKERGNWERDAGWKPPRPPSKTAAERQVILGEVVKRHGLRANQVFAKFSHADMVFHAAREVGADPTLGRARWREASGFAHGRAWPLLSHSTIEGGERIPGGYHAILTLHEERFAPVAELSFSILERAILAWADLSDADPGDAAN